MKKQYYLTYDLKSGKYGFKNLGHDLTEEEVEKALKRKIKSKNCCRVVASWGYVGKDIPDDEMFKDYFIKGYYKNFVELMGCKVYFEDDIKEII